MYLPRFELNWIFAFLLSIHHFLSFFCVSLLHHFLIFLLVCVCEPFFTNSHLSFVLLLVCVCMPFVANSHLSFFLLCVGPFHNFLYFCVCDMKPSSMHSWLYMQTWSALSFSITTEVQFVRAWVCTVLTIYYCYFACTCVCERLFHHFLPFFWVFVYMCKYGVIWVAQLQLKSAHEFFSHQKSSSSKHEGSQDAMHRSKNRCMSNFTYAFNSILYMQMHAHVCVIVHEGATGLIHAINFRVHILLPS